MVDEEDDFPIRHVILYAKGHYYWGRLADDLIKIGKKINAKVSKTKHIIQLIGPVIYAAIQEYSYKDPATGEIQSALNAYMDQWILLLSLRNEFHVDWLKYPMYSRLSFEEQDKLKELFQEEFDNRVLQAFISPLIGWVPTIDLGAPSSKYLPVASDKKEKV